MGVLSKLCSTRKIYTIGDDIQWKTCKDGSICPWVYFNQDDGANIGDPSIQNLIVRDSAQYWLEGYICKKCQQRISGGAIEIRRGVIKKAWLYMPHELDNSADIYIIDTTGNIKSMPEWDDHKMTTVNIC